jgi:hypothetical protein
MERFISAKFFRSLLEASHKGIDTDAQVLKKEFTGFAQSVFSEGAATTDRRAYLDSLVYTRVELSGLTGCRKKKCGNSCPQSPCVPLQIGAGNQRFGCAKSKNN